VTPYVWDDLVNSEIDRTGFRYVEFSCPDSVLKTSLSSRLFLWRATPSHCRERLCDGRGTARLVSKRKKRSSTLFHHERAIDDDNDDEYPNPHAIQSIRRRRRKSWTVRTIYLNRTFRLVEHCWERRDRLNRTQRKIMIFRYLSLGPVCVSLSYTYVPSETRVINCTSAETVNANNIASPRDRPDRRTTIVRTC